MRGLRRFIRFVAGLIVFLFLVAGILWAILALVRPDAALFVAGALWSTITVPQSPPPIAEGLVSNGRDWMNFEPTSSKFTAALRRRFPQGSDADALHDGLKAQGFGDETWPHQKAVCAPRDDIEISPTSRLVHCPPVPWQHSLHYMWGGVVCRQDLTVLWSADARNRIAQVVGFYGATCL